MKAQRVLMPVTAGESWTVVDEDFVAESRGVVDFRAGGVVTTS